MDKILWGVGSAVVEQPRRKSNMVGEGNGKFGLEADPRIPPNKQ